MLLVASPDSKSLVSEEIGVPIKNIPVKRAVRNCTNKL